MSRHRAVRNLDIDDVLEEDTYSDDYDENELDEGDLNDEDRQELEDGLSYVRSVVGEDIGISDTEIKEALWYYYFDREETVNWVFDKVAKIKAEEEKQKKKAAKKAAAAASKDMRVTDTVADRKPRYRRPPARLYADVQPSSSPMGSSLQSLAQRTAINTKTTQKSSSLQSLAQKAAGQRGMSALQTLASRQQQRTATTLSSTTTTTSPSSSPKPSSLAALAQKSSASKGRTSLAHLATRSSSSETSTRPTSSNQGLSALAKLASKSNMSDKPTSLSSSLEKQQQQQQQPVKETMKPVTTPEKTLPMINDQPANPLCAKPSAAANFLFMHLYPQQTNATSLPIPAFSSIGQVFYDAAKPLNDTIKAFAFDVPSPDDVVMEAQSHRSGGPTPTQSKKTKSKAPTSASNQSDDQLSQDMLGMGLEDVAKKAAQARLKVSSATSTPAGTPPDTPRSASPLAKIPASKRVNVVEEYAKRSGEKPKLNLVVIGHVDAGKSTLMGHLLYEIGHVNDRTMKKYERDSQKIGKGSFAYAWVLDETGEERDRGITMDIATNNFETEHRSFTLLDAPGHRDFIPNMISGTAQADAAVLVVDASTGGFESGFEANGQTKEHAILARSLGVQQMIIAVNKLDTLDWNQGRFDSIVEKLNLFLVQAGFRKSNLTYIPVSGLTGENLINKSDLVNWYSGPSLLELIDSFEPPVRALDKPLRMGVTDFFKGGIGSSGGVSVGGSIDAGHVQVGEQVMVVPGGEIGIVKAMQVNDETSTWAAAGDSVLMTLSGLDIMNLSNGCVICNPQFPVPVTSSFTAQIVVFDLKIPITAGFPVVLHQQSLDEPASIIKLLCTLDKSTGEVTKRNPRHLGKGMTAKVKIQLSNRAIPIETFKQNKQLGRIMLRRGGETIAAGVVDEILTFGS